MNTFQIIGTCVLCFLAGMTTMLIVNEILMSWAKSRDKKLTQHNRNRSK